MQLNADVLDLVLINRRTTADARCLDLENTVPAVNVTWGGNVKIVCMDDQEWKRRYVDFFCSSQYGWNCNTTEYNDVKDEFQSRKDSRNYFWRPLFGYVFHDLFLHPDNPFWAWMDMDVALGNFNHYPFNILSGLSILTGSAYVPNFIFMAGQLTAFNMDDEAVGSAWKRFPEMRSPAHFTKYIEGKMPDSEEEHYWSNGYLGSHIDRPGTDLSWGIYPDIHADDVYHQSWNWEGGQPQDQVFLQSGRDLLLASISYDRDQIEHLVKVERAEPLDDLGSIGWTGGLDGSTHLVNNPNSTSSEAQLLAMRDAENLQESVHRDLQQPIRMHEGIILDRTIHEDCHHFWFTQCVDTHPLAVSEPPIVRASLVRFKNQQPGHVLMRLERDDRHRGYERKLLRHYLRIKHKSWFELPPFDITPDLVLRYNSDFIEVFKIGQPSATLYYREQKDATKNIG